MSEESSSRKKSKMTGIADTADEDPNTKAPTDPRLAQRDPRLAPTDPRLAPTDPRLALKNPTMKEAEKEGGTPMPFSSNGNITFRKRVHRSEDAPPSNQAASQVNPPIATTTTQNMCQPRTGQSANKDKDSEIEDLKGQVQYWRDQADLAQRLSKNNCQLSSTNVEQERLIGALERENTLLKTRNEKLEKDLAIEREEKVKMKIEVAVAKKERDLIEKTALELTDRLKDVEDKLNSSKVNEAKMEGKVELLSVEREQVNQRVLQLYKEKEELVEQLKEVKAEAKLAAKSQKSRVALEEELAKLQLDVNKHMSEKKEIREEKVKLREKYEALKKEKRSAWEFWGVALRNVAGTLSNGASENQAVNAKDEFSSKMEAVRNAHHDEVNALQNDINNLNEKHEAEKKKMEELHRDQLAALQDRVEIEEEEKLEKERQIMKDDIQKEIENLMEGSVQPDFGKEVNGDQEDGSGTD